MSLKIWLFICVCAMCTFTSTQQEEEKRPTYQEMLKVINDLQKKLDDLGIKVDNITIPAASSQPKEGEKEQTSNDVMTKIINDLKRQIAEADTTLPPSQTSCSDNKCLIYKDTQYIVLPIKVNWPRAKVLCIQNDMRLAMPKDKETDEALRKQLMAIYGHNSKTRLWFGLKRVGQVWQWVDGSVLGDYTGGQPWVFNKKACASMYASGEGWHPDICARNSGFDYFPLCEKHIVL